MRKISGLIVIVMLALLLAACGTEADREARKGGTINEKNDQAIELARETPTEVVVVTEAPPVADVETAVASPVAGEATPAVVASPVIGASPVASPVTVESQSASPAAMILAGWR